MYKSIKDIRFQLFKIRLMFSLFFYLLQHHHNQVIKNPVTDHLPTGCAKIGTSYHSDQMVDVRQLAQDKPVVLVVGAMAHGKVKNAVTQAVV